jgi:phage head maturation protease
MNKVRVTAKRFKETIANSGGVCDFKDRSKFIVCKQTNGADVEQVDDFKLQWTISSGDVDRSKDIVDPAGWSFDNWIKGGSILWSHDPTTLPVAKPDKERPVWVDNGKVKSIAVYPDVGLNEFGHTVYRMAQEGFIRGASVGFLSEDFEEAEDRDGFMPIDFKRQELLEWSHTPVPDNPHALLEAKAAGISLAPLKAWVSRVLDESVPIVGHSREELEKTYALCDDKKSVSVEVKEKHESDVEKDVVEKGVITYDQAHGGGTPKADENAEWDGPAEVSAASVEDLSVMCAWFDSDDAENKSAYKFPHHRAADKAVVKQAVTSAIAVLNGARGGADIPDGDRAGVYTHLTRHLREDFEVPNEEIPELRSDATEAEPVEEEEEKTVDTDRFANLEDRLKAVEMLLSNLEESVKSLQSAPDVPVEDATKQTISAERRAEIERDVREAFMRADLPTKLRSLFKSKKRESNL